MLKSLIISTLIFPTLALAGTLEPSQSEWHEHYSKQENAPASEEMLLNSDPEPELVEGFQNLFNGKSLDGWTSRGGTCLFTVDDGCIVGEVAPGSSSTYLCTDRTDYEDFVFTCDLSWDVDGNTGVMFRADSKPSKSQFATVFGPQAEMEGFSKDRGWSGGIYGQSCGGFFYPLWLKEHAEARKALKKDEWNRLTIKAEGDTVQTWVNGVPVSQWVDDGSYPTGFFGLQIHKGEKGKVRFKNIRVRELN